MSEATESRKGLLSRAFNSLDASNKRQFAAGLAATFAAYAATGLAVTVDTSAATTLARDLLFTDFGWKNLAFNFILIASASTVGAATMAVYDKFRKKDSTPEPGL